MMRNIDAEYDELMDELEEAVDENDPGERGARIRVVRLQIEELLQAQMSHISPPPSDRRTGPNALN